MNFLKKLVLLFTLVGLVLTVSPITLAAEIADGAEIFRVHCAACHLAGGNIIRRGKNLKSKALKRNGMDSIEAIALLVEHGKNPMPAYRDRLSEQQMQAVSAYVLEQAAVGWKEGS